MTKIDLMTGQDLEALGRGMAEKMAVALIDFDEEAAASARAELIRNLADQNATLSDTFARKLGWDADDCEFACALIGVAMVERFDEIAARRGNLTGGRA